MTDFPTQEGAQTAVALIDAAAGAGRMSASGAANAKNWLTRPHYRDYHARILDAVRQEKFAELDSLFWEVLPFGTGGRRGRMAEFGSATINDRTIAESAHGMAVYLNKVKGAPGGRAVIAYDTRNRSSDFARITAATFAAHGLTAYLFEGHRSTPALSFAVRHLQCDVGVMISASHNPPSDNGFKAYWSDGAQVLPPHDKGIIECVIQSEEIPTVDFNQAVARGLIKLIGDEVDREYVSCVEKLSLSGARDLRGVFTPLHGVGETSVFRVLQNAGFNGVEIFEPQRTADGNFTNVPEHLPNPELTSAFRPAVEFAHRGGADLVLASDPDADRLAISVRESEGAFVHLTGNQVGALLADYVLRKRAAAKTLTPEHFVCTTLVTTPMIGAIGRAFGVAVVEDLLVGFKYIAQTVEMRGADKFIFGCEESLGYLAGQYCRDKDAAIAALYVCELAAELRGEGKTLLDGLDRLYEKHGYFIEGQRWEACQGPRGKEQIDSLMRTLRKDPPRDLAGVQMTRLRDYREQVVRAIPDGKTCGQLQTTRGDLLFLDSQPSEKGDSQTEFSIAVRPSGTEPKIKFYFFARGIRNEGEALDAIKTRTNSAMTAVQEALSQWVQTVLDTGAKPT
jgi:phosphoglucomutase/phosphomannomutase